MGNDVKCLDIDEGKISRLRQGIIPIHEPGLDIVVRRNVEAGRLSFTLDAKEAAEFGVIQMIAMGTPPDEDGSADLKYVLAAARNIGRYMPAYRVVVDKSTVPVGTGDKVEEAIGGGVDYAFEMAGSVKALELAYRITARGGTTVTAGLPNPAAKWELQAVSLIAEERTVKGSYIGSCVPARDVPRFVAMYRAGHLPVNRLLSERVPLAEINPALDRLARGEAIRQVIMMD